MIDNKMYFLTSDVLLRPWFFINVMKSFSPLLTRKETSATAESYSKLAML